MTPRTRLESFRSRQQPSTAAEHTRASGFQLKLPGKPLVPKLGLSSLSIGGSAIRAPEAAAAPAVKDAPSAASESAARPKPTNHAANHHSANDGSLSSRPLSARRLPKHALSSDSTTAGSASEAAVGHAVLTDHMGTPRSVRVVQQDKLEDYNMVSVKW